MISCTADKWQNAPFARGRGISETTGRGAAQGALGRIDVLVNNAGIYTAARLVDTTPEDFDRVMQVNLEADGPG